MILSCFFQIIHLDIRDSDKLRTKNMVEIPATNIVIQGQKYYPACEIRHKGSKFSSGHYVTHFRDFFSDASYIVNNEHIECITSGMLEKKTNSTQFGQITHLLMSLTNKSENYLFESDDEDEVEENLFAPYAKTKFSFILSKIPFEDIKDLAKACIESIKTIDELVIALTNARLRTPTEEEYTDYEEAIKEPHDETVVAEVFSTILTRRIMFRLTKGEWIHDEVLLNINFFIEPLNLNFF